MKTKLYSGVSVVLAILLVFCFASCGKKVDKTGLWEQATYLSDTTLGKGAKTVSVEVKAEDQSVLFTVKTDEKTVGAALLAVDLIAGDNSAYGLYVKKVNGITADYDTDKAYWAFYLNGEYASTGVDSTDIDESVKYSLVYTKG